MQLALAEQAAASASASAPLSAAVDLKNIVKRKEEGGESPSVFALESAQGQGQGKTLVSEID